MLQNYRWASKVAVDPTVAQLLEELIALLEKDHDALFVGEVT